MKGKEKEGDQKINGYGNTIENDMRAISVCVGDVENRVKWRFRTKVADPK